MRDYEGPGPEDMIGAPEAVIEDGKVVYHERVTVDLDDLERKARAADADEWRWDASVLEGVHDGQVVLFANLDARETDEPEIIASIANKAHIAANSPPVTLALIARIRELEAAGREIAEAPHQRYQMQQIALLRALLDNGVVLP